MTKAVHPNPPDRFDAVDGDGDCGVLCVSMRKKCEFSKAVQETDLARYSSVGITNNHGDSYSKPIPLD